MAAMARRRSGASAGRGGGRAAAGVGTAGAAAVVGRGGHGAVTAEQLRAWGWPGMRRARRWLGATARDAVGGGGAGSQEEGAWEG